MKAGTWKRAFGAKRRPDEPTVGLAVGALAASVGAGLLGPPALCPALSGEGGPFIPSRLPQLHV